MLKRAVQSVLDQTYEKLQVCIYDNASEDDTESIVSEMKERDERIHYFRHPKNIGMTNNFNFGASRVTTPFFSFLSDDDVLLPGFYEKALRCFNRYPEILFAAGETIYVKNEKVVALRTHEEGYYSPPESLLKMVEGRALNYPALPATLFRQDVVNKVGLFDAEIPTADVDLEYRTMAAGPFVLFKKPCAIMEMHASSTSELADYRSVWPGWLKTIKNITASGLLSPSASAQFAKAFNSCLTRQIYWLSLKSIRSGNVGSAYDAAEVLKHEYGLKMYPFALNILAKTQELSPPAYALLMSLRSTVSPFFHPFYLKLAEKKSKSETEKALQPYLKYIYG
jgi:GT2 family glycosyltransferase